MIWNLKIAEIQNVPAFGMFFFNKINDLRNGMQIIQLKSYTFVNF